MKKAGNPQSRISGFSFLLVRRRDPKNQSKQLKTKDNFFGIFGNTVKNTVKNFFATPVYAHLHNRRRLQQTAEIGGILPPGGSSGKTQSLHREFSGHRKGVYFVSLTLESLQCQCWRGILWIRICLSCVSCRLSNVSFQRSASIAGAQEDTDAGRQVASASRQSARKTCFLPCPPFSFFPVKAAVEFKNARAFLIGFT
ncbi:MAG: hypothetical protein LBL69_05360 [Zoogloeaceae bacterium]|jgi:hypothetical protein|nr:hypothetical protein [Zoogloeaceae bacterium]